MPGVETRGPSPTETDEVRNDNGTIAKTVLRRYTGSGSFSYQIHVEKGSEEDTNVDTDAEAEEGEKPQSPGLLSRQTTVADHEEHNVSDIEATFNCRRRAVKVIFEDNVIGLIGSLCHAFSTVFTRGEKDGVFRRV